MLDKTSSNKTTDFDDGFAVGFMFGRQKGRSYNISGSDDSGTRYYYKDDPDWKWFDETPDPAPNQQIYGVRVFDPKSKNAKFNNEYCSFYFDLPSYIEASIGSNIIYYYGYTVDWGDGTITKFPTFSYDKTNTPNTLTEMVNERDSGRIHSYETVGDYVITITIDFPLQHTNMAFLVSRNTSNTVYQNNEPVVIFSKIGSRFYKYVSYLPYPSEKEKYSAGYFFRQIFVQSIKFLKIPSLLRYALYYNDMGTTMLQYMYSLKYLELTVDNSLYPFPVENSALSKGFVNQFSGLYSLEKTNVNLSDYEDNIPQTTFYQAYSLIFPEVLSCKEIGYMAFRGCYRIKHIKLLNCTVMDCSAFTDCYNLETVDAESCIEISHLYNNMGIFSGCYGLKKISFPKLTVWDSTLEYFPNLVEIDLPSCTIFKGTIQNCYSLSKITVADGCDFSKATIQNCHALGQRPDNIEYP